MSDKDIDDIAYNKCITGFSNWMSSCIGVSSLFGKCDYITDEHKEYCDKIRKECQEEFFTNICGKDSGHLAMHKEQIIHWNKYDRNKEKYTLNERNIRSLTEDLYLDEYKKSGIQYPKIFQDVIPHIVKWNSCMKKQDLIKIKHLEACKSFGIDEDFCNNIYDKRVYEDIEIESIRKAQTRFR
jgi:hypothetical protein